MPVVAEELLALGLEGGPKKDRGAVAEAVSLEEEEEEEGAPNEKPEGVLVASSVFLSVAVVAGLAAVVAPKLKPIPPAFAPVSVFISAEEEGVEVAVEEEVVVAPNPNPPAVERAEDEDEEEEEMAPGGRPREEVVEEEAAFFFSSICLAASGAHTERIERTREREGDGEKESVSGEPPSGRYGKMSS